MVNKLNLVGQVFGQLTVLKVGKGKRRSTWICKCECGNIKEAVGSSLKRGQTKSCGCLRSIYKTHGLSGTKEHRTWKGIRDRCLNSNHVSYKSYGERGITICNKWRDDFLTFLADVGNAPGPEYSLDRINNNGNYEPGNVRWVEDYSIQLINRRTPKSNTSGVKGVYWDKARSKWIAVIGINKKRIYLGAFSNKQDAIKARKDAEEKYHKPLLNTI